jgi:hypothetical protein
VAQATPEAQATQAPPLHTRFEPQLAPFGSAAPFTHWEVPVAQLVTPAWQSGSGCVAQATPAVQETQAPPLHTRFVPQAVPSGVVPVGVQTGNPVSHEIAASWHGIAHAPPGVQVPKSQVALTEPAVPQSMV